MSEADWLWSAFGAGWLAGAKCVSGMSAGWGVGSDSHRDASGVCFLVGFAREWLVWRFIRSRNAAYM